MESRFLINDYAILNKIPYVFGSAAADKGFAFNILPEKPCLRCIFSGQATETCDTSGILNSGSGFIGSIMANEAIKIITGKPEDHLLRIDFWRNEFMKIDVKRNAHCPACGGNYEYLNGEKHSKAIKLCGSGVYQIKDVNVDLDALGKRLRKLDHVISLPGVIHIKNISVFEDGRVIIKASSEREARSIYSKYIGN